MSVPDLVIETDPDAQDVRVLDDGLYEYNVAQTRIDDGRLLGIFLRDERGQIMAGVYGWTWGGVLEVNKLWVRADARGRGYGTQLLQAAEREGIRRGAQLALLDTYSFQAPEFYQQHGYQVYGELDYPLRWKKYFLKKILE